MNLSNRRIPERLETPRLIIARNKPEQAEALFEAASESIPTVFPFLPWCHPGYEMSETTDWLKYAYNQWDTGRSYGFGIYEKPGGEFIGGCGVNRFDEHPTMNLGYWIRSSAVGKGYATEATQALVKFGFEHLHLIRIEIIMSVHNIASKRVAERAGAVFEGTMKNRLLLHGKAHDAHLYALTAENS